MSNPAGWPRTPDYLQTEIPLCNGNKRPAQTSKTCNVLGFQLQLQPRLPRNLGSIKHCTACQTCRHHYCQLRLKLNHGTHEGSVMDTATSQPRSSRAGNSFSFPLTHQDDKQQTASFFQVKSTSSSLLSWEFCRCLRHKRTNTKRQKYPKNQVLLLHIKR